MTVTQLRGGEAGGNFGVIFGLEAQSLFDEVAAHGVVVGERAVVHQALIVARRKGMRAVGARV